MKNCWWVAECDYKFDTLVLRFKEMCIWFYWHLMKGDTILFRCLSPRQIYRSSTVLLWARTIRAFFSNRSASGDASNNVLTSLWDLSLPVSELNVVLYSTLYRNLSSVISSRPKSEERAYPRFRTPHFQLRLARSTEFPFRPICHTSLLFLPLRSLTITHTHFTNESLHERLKRLFGHFYITLI